MGPLRKNDYRRLQLAIQILSSPNMLIATATPKRKLQWLKTFVFKTRFDRYQHGSILREIAYCEF